MFASFANVQNSISEFRHSLSQDHISVNELSEVRVLWTTLQPSMFRNILRPISSASAHWQNRRAISYVSSHSVSPATLYRFQVRPESKLFDKKLEQDDWEWEDGIEVAHDGLVYPRISSDGMDCPAFLGFCCSHHASFKRSAFYAKYPFHAGGDTEVI